MIFLSLPLNLQLIRLYDVLFTADVVEANTLLCMAVAHTWIGMSGLTENTTVSKFAQRKIPFCRNDETQENIFQAIAIDVIAVLACLEIPRG